MVKELNYTTLSHVMDSWEQLRRIKDYEKMAGTLLFQRLFEKCPDVKPLFGFPIDIDPHSPELLSSKRFVMHASYLVQMLDTALNMLGPDIELLTEIMTELGAKHIRYGVKPEMFAVMEDALLHTLQETLKDDFDESHRQSWTEVYEALSSDMKRAMSKSKSRSSS